MRPFQLSLPVIVVVLTAASLAKVTLAIREQVTQEIRKKSALSEDAPQPRWYPQFTVKFNETTRIILTKHTDGIWYYDAVNNKEALYRGNGNGDRYCGSVHPLSQTPCIHVVTDNKRYLVFPDLGECCMCCTAAQGCGIVSPGWLNGAIYKGVVEMQGVPAYKWEQDGLQPNYWYTTADDAQIPLELDQIPNDFQAFWPDTFEAGAPPEDVFQLPDNCKSRCSITSVCSIV